MRQAWWWALTVLWSSCAAVLVLRLLQVLGAYGLRGITEGKAAFITPMASVARELGKLKGWMLRSGHAGPASVVGSLGELRPVAQSGESRDELIVTVMSFSYKRGLPRDYSGNGGGFVFDCRYPNNPADMPNTAPLRAATRR